MDYSQCHYTEEPKFQSMGDIKRASKAFLENDQDPIANSKLNSYREFRTCCIETSLQLLEDIGLPAHVFVSARLKRMESIHRKLMKSGSSTYVNNIDDIIGFRVIFRSLKELRDVVQKLKSQEIKNYIDNDHPIGHGYRGVHVIFRFKQPFNTEQSFTVRFEVQMRTYFQHQWAGWCESMGEQAKEGYPGRHNEPEIKEKLKNLRQVSDKIKLWEEGNSEVIQGAGKVLFPVRSELSKKFAVIRINSDDYKVEECISSKKAFEDFITYENNRLKSLLLLGLSKDKIESHFEETHLYPLLNLFPEPEHWMPTVE